MLHVYWGVCWSISDWQLTGCLGLVILLIKYTEYHYSDSLVLLSTIYVFLMLFFLRAASRELIISLNSWCLMKIKGFWFWAPVYQNNRVVEGNGVTSSTQSHNLNTKGPLNDVVDVTRPVWMNLFVIHGNHQREKSLSGETVATDFVRAHLSIISNPPYHILFSSCRLL